MRRVVVLVTIIICLLEVNFLFGQEINIDKVVVESLIIHDSLFFEHRNPSSTVVCLNCNTNNFKFNGYLVLALDKESCIKFLNKHIEKEFIVIKINRIDINNPKIILNYSIGILNSSYYNKHMQFVSEISERNYTFLIKDLMVD